MTGMLRVHAVVCRYLRFFNMLQVHIKYKIEIPVSRSNIQN